MLSTLLFFFHLCSSGMGCSPIPFESVHITTISENAVCKSRQPRTIRATVCTPIQCRTTVESYTPPPHGRWYAIAARTSTAATYTILAGDTQGLVVTTSTSSEVFIPAMSPDRVTVTCIQTGCCDLHGSWRRSQL